MSDAPKSAFELAMEKLKKKDAESGVEAQVLTEAQRAEIAEAKNVYEARVAERRILHQSAVLSRVRPGGARRPRRRARRDLDRFASDRDAKIKKIRSGRVNTAAPAPVQSPVATPSPTGSSKPPGWTSATRAACSTGTPAFTLTALVTLALAIGVNTAVFALVNAVLLKPLPYPHPERLHLLSQAHPAGRPVRGNTAVDGRTWELVRDRAPSVNRAVFSNWTTGVNLVVRAANGSEQALFVRAAARRQRVLLGTRRPAARRAGVHRLTRIAPTGRRRSFSAPDCGGQRLAPILPRSVRRSPCEASPTPSSASCPTASRPARARTSGRRCGRPPPARVAAPTTSCSSACATDSSRPQALAEMAGIAEELQRQRPADSKGQVVSRRSSACRMG